jgi:BirA family biotin operon repressor/biotin-[acetyl-CoA-carboxylase] ligase
MEYEGLSLAALAARIHAPSCLALPKVTSTLDILHELAEEGAPAGTVVLADEQVRGRGRQGRPWTSAPGAGVWLGYLMRPSDPFEGGVLSLRVGMAVVDALGAVGVATSLKWPNDIVADDRKLAGVLCEARWVGSHLAWIAVGLGVNVYGPVAPELVDCAIALDELQPGVTRLQVLEQLIPRLHGLSVSSELTEEERVRFDSFNWLGDRRIVEPVEGKPVGIDVDGALLVRTPVGVERVMGGSVVVT